MVVDVDVEIDVVLPRKVVLEIVVDAVTFCVVVVSCVDVDVAVADGGRSFSTMSVVELAKKVCVVNPGTITVVEEVGIGTVTVNAN